MRCTYSLCQSGNTKLIERTCRLVHVDGRFADCQFSELWLCNTCGNPFHPGVSKVMPWHLRWRLSPKRKSRRIPKAEIIKELFADG